jgi:3-hydroxybutyryl-CoA dehydrogenase
MDSAAEATSETKPRVAVIGAGTMGAGIAQVAAAAGHEVFLVDATPDAASAAIERTNAVLARQVAKGRLTAEEASSTRGRLHPVTAVGDLPDCGVVIEAIPEDLDLKRRLFAAVAESQPATTILATNTSSLDVSAIAEAVPDPERVLGLHFFNPPPLMRLVEVIHGAATSEAYLAHAMTLMREWGKEPVRCSSTPGFIVNRVARPFYGEAQRVVEAGIADPATVDWILRERGGFRMGPFELTDLIGQDVNYAVGASVWEQTGQDPRYAPTQFQRDLVESGRLGRKSGEGVFTYDAQRGPAVPAPDLGLAERLVGGPVETDPLARTVVMLVNEAVDLVARGEATADDVDTAMKLGTNYPKGPLEWGREIGYDVVAVQLAELDRVFPGGRYRASVALTEATTA